MKIADRVKIVKETEDPQSDFEVLPVGTVLKKIENKPDHPTQIPFVWIPENIKEGEDIEWDYILSEREVRLYMEAGILKNL